MPLHVIPATGPILERILDDTFAMWHDGMSRENYGRFWAGQLKTAWGAAHLDRVALVDGPHVVSSAKRYDLSLRIDGRIRRVLGIGAVFTAPAYRGRGAARELISRMLETAVAEGQEFAMLFSEIAPAFYERLDFVPVPLVEKRLEVNRMTGGPPAMLVRSGDDRDLPWLVDMGATRAAGARLALNRSEDFMRFGVSKMRLHSGLGAPQLRTTEFLVVEEGHQAVAYLVCSVSRSRRRPTADGRQLPGDSRHEETSWTIEEAGDRDPSGARLGAMLQTMLSRHPADPLPDIRAWWPQSLAPPQVRIASVSPTHEVLMIRPLRDRLLPLPPLAADEVVFWHADYF